MSHFSKIASTLISKYGEGQQSKGRMVAQGHRKRKTDVGKGLLVLSQYDQVMN